MRLSVHVYTAPSKKIVKSIEIGKKWRNFSVLYLITLNQIQKMLIPVPKRVKDIKDVEPFLLKTGYELKIDLKKH